MKTATKRLSPTVEKAPVAVEAEANGSKELYFGWEQTPVAVTRHRKQGPLSWESARLVLQDRVKSAVGASLRDGWRMDGTFTAAVRWNMASEAGSDIYQGCWVRFRRDELAS